MSCNRENVIWQSADGRWNRAFYDFYPVGQDREDWDYEWDVEYTSDFNWVRTGLASFDAAHDAWDGANPGSYDKIEYGEATAAECDRLDAQAAQWLKDNPPSAKTFGGRW